MRVAIITGGGANFYSIKVVLQQLAVDYIITGDEQTILAADAAILPGVGAAGYAMKQLRQLGIIDTIRNYTKPLLGICLGMQLLYEYSAEGEVECLGIFPGQVQRLPPGAGLTIPHMGWNELAAVKPSQLLTRVAPTQDFYFVHSYCAPVNEVTVAVSQHGISFAAVAEQANFYAVQFHPEKSGQIGAQLMRNFMGIVNASISSN